MSRAYKQITVNNPNGQVLIPTAPPLPLSEWVEVQTSDDRMEQVQIWDMHLPNFSMRASKGQFAYDALLVNQDDNGLDLFASCLFPKGTVRTYTQSFDEPTVECFDGTQNFKFDPQNEFKHLIPAQSPFHIIHFAVPPEHFIQFLPEDEAWADDLKTKFFRKERIIGQRANAISLAQERALQNIIDCPLSGKLGTILIETSMVQIMLLQLDILFRDTKSARSVGLTKRDHDTIHSVKEYLASSFLEDHSLEMLAKNFATNTNKLMTLFKKTFNKSIFEFISDLRMEHAYQLLTTEEFLVNEVARTVGYKNPHHFSTAFKKRFGICPSQLV